jgi:hypothetical protein
MRKYVRFATLQTGFRIWNWSLCKNLSLPTRWKISECVSG